VDPEAVLVILDAETLGQAYQAVGCKPVGLTQLAKTA
jgi:hypothetical protein